MKILKVLFISFLATTLMIGCEDDDNVTPNNPTEGKSEVDQFSMLEVGNYWIYERYTIDTNGIETALGIYDSSYVEKDTLINGKLYAVLILPSYLSNFNKDFILRDSLDYLVDHRGKILFALNNFNSLLYSNYNLISATDTIYHHTRKMKDKDSLVSVPAGTFLTYNAYEKVDYMGSFSPLVDHSINKLYAKGIGLIYNTQVRYSSATESPVQKLVRYSVQ
tara:strand:- start:3163 stop:3825 length:663 start_codon:yes stop_codon:yes gene_type:complete